jgi:spore cortex formation protein SpoVR/YcgB (stage V sporulation)
VKKRQLKKEKEKEEKAKEKELLSATTPEDSTGNATAPSPKHTSTTPVVETPVTAFTPKPDDDVILFLKSDTISE